MPLLTPDMVPAEPPRAVPVRDRIKARVRFPSANLATALTAGFIVLLADVAAFGPDPWLRGIAAVVVISLGYIVGHRDGRRDHAQDTLKELLRDVRRDERGA